MAKQQFYSRGKVLLTGEYAVVKGAKAIAFPAKLGQTLTVSTGRGSDIRWKSLDENGDEWFSAKISLFDFSPMKSSDDEIAARLAEILVAAVRLNSEFLSTWKGIKVETKLEFPRKWGLGSSSTLVSNIAAWADVDPFELYANTFGGSGYDIACSMSDSPIVFQMEDRQVPNVSKVKIPDSIFDKMTFVYSGKKQSSQNALQYIEENEVSRDMIHEVNKISDELLNGSDIKQWIKSLHKHNEIVSKYLNARATEPDLEDFDGVVKPLGAWGGDFMLAISNHSFEKVQDYFNGKGYEEVFPASKLILCKESALES